MTLIWAGVFRWDLPQEVGLLGLTEVADSDMWQHLFLQNFFGIFYSSFFCHARFGSSGTDEVQRHILLLDHKRFIQRRLHLETR